jgi:hypothetical protein
MDVEVLAAIVLEVASIRPLLARTVRYLCGESAGAI